MSRIGIKDPFSDLVFEIDPEATMNRCREIWERNGKNHDFCTHCQKLRDRLEIEVENLSLLTALGESVTEAEAAIAFAEMAKPWGEPCAGPTDTQPYAPVDPEAPMPDEFFIGEETGFAVVK